MATMPCLWQSRRDRIPLEYASPLGGGSGFQRFSCAFWRFNLESFFFRFFLHHCQRRFVALVAPAEVLSVFTCFGDAFW